MGRLFNKWTLGVLAILGVALVILSWWVWVKPAGVWDFNRDWKVGGEEKFLADAVKLSQKYGNNQYNRLRVVVMPGLKETTRGMGTANGKVIYSETQKYGGLLMIRIYINTQKLQKELPGQIDTLMDSLIRLELAGGLGMQSGQSKLFLQELNSKPTINLMHLEQV